MPLRHITVPEDVTLCQPDGSPIEDGGKPIVIRFRDTVTRLLNHQAFGASRKGARAANAIEDAVRDLVPGDDLAIAEEDHAMLVKALDELACTQWSPLVHRQIVSHYDAIADAKDAPAVKAASNGAALDEAKAAS